MRIEYDPEACDFTEAVFQGLTVGGYQEFVFQAHDEISEAEGFVLDFLTRAAVAVEQGDPFLGFDALGDDVKRRTMAQGWIDSIGLRDEMTVGEFLVIARKLQRKNPRKTNRQLRSFLALILETLAPNGVYKPELPFNAISALNALFHVLVAPRRCFAYAAKVFDGLEQSIQIVNFDGSCVYGADEQENAHEDEDRFWSLWDEADSIWGLRDRVIARPQIRQTDQRETDTVSPAKDMALIVWPESVNALSGVIDRFAFTAQQVILAREEGLAA